MLFFWSFYQTARRFPKHLEQLMELEWSVTPRVEIGSWKQRHPVGLMLESSTWEGLSSNSHPTHKEKELEKSQWDPVHTTMCLWVLLPMAMSGEGPSSPHWCPWPSGADTALCCEGQHRRFGLPEPKSAPMSQAGRSSRKKPVFQKGQWGPSGFSEAASLTSIIAKIQRWLLHKAKCS